MINKHRRYIFLLILISIAFFSPRNVHSQVNETSLSSFSPLKLKLVQAEMCEEISELSPKNTAIVFSIDLGKVSCFTSFDSISENTHIYQKWFHRNKLSTKQKLRLKPPRWSTFSSIQLREGDKGPWHVEITDSEDNILSVLRFSIVD